jgi:hypothetical protein
MSNFHIFKEDFQENKIIITKNYLAVLTSFPLVGNLSERTGRIADKPQ